MMSASDMSKRPVLNKQAIAAAKKAALNKQAIAAANLDKLKRILATSNPGEMLSDSKVCNLLTSVLKEPEIQPDIAMKIIQNVEHCMTVLDGEQTTLIKTLMKIDWLSGGPELTQKFHSFMLNLISTHSNYFKPFLVVLIRMFKTEYKIPSDAEGESKMLIKREQDFRHVHIMLQSVCRLIPMTTVVLVALLDEVYPYVTKAACIHEVYVCNLLKITGYIPSLRKEILDLIVKNMLKLDVRISREALTNACTEDEEIEDEDIFEMDVGCDVKAPEPPKEDGVDKLANLLPQAVVLDSVMTIVLKYIRETCFPGGKLDWDMIKTLYRELLSSFDKYVFPTYLANHTQFVMFYVCSFKEALADGFVDYLWKKVTDPMSQPLYRQIAACYIGSFLARASYVPVSTAQTLMKLMMKWVHDYLDQTCDVNTPADLEHHSAFYSICQTCFYIFCFKHTQLMLMKNGHKRLEALNFQRLVTSKLNPLKFCLPIIVKTFSSATRTHQLAFCDTVIERNNRSTLPISSSNALGDCKQLYSFFPFDPYLLKQSGALITPVYKEFQGNLPDDDVLENEDEDDFLPDEDTHTKVHDMMSMSVEKNTTDFLQYSCSPGFQD